MPACADRELCKAALPRAVKENEMNLRAALLVTIQSLQAQPEDRGKHQRHKEAGQEYRPQADPARQKYADRDQHDVHRSVYAKQFVRSDEATGVDSDIRNSLMKPIETPAPAANRTKTRLPPTASA